MLPSSGLTYSPVSAGPCCAHIACTGRSSCPSMAEEFWDFWDAMSASPGKEEQVWQFKQQTPTIHFILGVSSAAARAQSISAWT